MYVKFCVFFLQSLIGIFMHDFKENDAICLNKASEETSFFLNLMIYNKKGLIYDLLLNSFFQSLKL